MPVAGKADVVIDKTTLGTTGFVTVTTGDATHTAIFLQDLYDAMREWEDNLENIDVEALVDASGRDGVGGGNEKPITMAVRAHVQVKAADKAGPSVVIFTYDGGTILSDEESSGAADPRSPFTTSTFVQYDRAKGQEGLALFSQEMIDMWTRLFGGIMYQDASTAKEVIRNPDNSLFSEADTWSDDGVTPYDGTSGIVRRDEHVKP